MYSIMSSFLSKNKDSLFLIFFTNVSCDNFCKNLVVGLKSVSISYFSLLPLN